MKIKNEIFNPRQLIQIPYFSNLYKLKMQYAGVVYETLVMESDFFTTDDEHYIAFEYTGTNFHKDCILMKKKKIKQTTK